MEEILASIRRIISEEGSDAAVPAAASPAPKARREGLAPADDVLELTEIVNEDGSTEIVEPYDSEAIGGTAADEVEEPAVRNTAGTNAVEPPAEPVAAVEESPMPEPKSPQPDEDSLLSGTTAKASTDALASLLRTVDRGEDAPMDTQGLGSRTVEEVVREVLRPLLRDWLDQNLPGLVERLVKQEIRRIVRRAEEEE